MASSSSIGKWVDFRLLTQELPLLEPCSSQGVVIDCSDICLASGDLETRYIHAKTLWDPATPANLVNCGLFWTVAMWIFFNPNSTTLSDSPTWTVDHLAQFKSIGLPWPTQGFWPALLPGFNCFGVLRSIETNGDITPEISFSSVCSFDTVFGYESLKYSERDDMKTNLAICVQELCTPKGTLNPDLGGVGVSTVLLRWFYGQTLADAFQGLFFFHYANHYCNPRRRAD